MIYHYSSIVFIILGIILQEAHIFLRVCFVILGVSSTIFHMLDHEIDKDYYLHDYMEYIYFFDMFMITLITSFIQTNSIVLSLCVSMMCYHITHVKNVLYVIGLCKFILKLMYNETYEIFFLYLLIIVYSVIALLDNHDIYHKKPYHITWKAKNAFIWHTCNFVTLYKGLS